MANFTGDCRNDLDCSELQFCYRNVSWAPDRIFCDCNSFWGWEGDDCLSFGINTYFLIIEPSCVIAICMVALLLATANCVSFCTNQRPTKDLFTSFAVVYAALVCTLGWNIAIVLSATSPDRIITETLTSPGKEITTADPTEKKFGFYEEFEALFQTGVYFFSFLSFTSVSIVWMSVVAGVKSLKVGKSLPKLRWFVRIFQAIFILTLVIMWAIGAETLAFGIILAAVSLGLTAIAYTYALRKLVAVLSSFPQSKETYGELIRSLHTNARNIVVSIFLTFVFLITYSGFQLSGGWKAYSPQGTLSVHALIRQLGFFCMLVANLQIYCYLRSIILKKGRSSSKSGPTYVSGATFQSGSHVDGNSI